MNKFIFMCACVCVCGVLISLYLSFRPRLLPTHRFLTSQWIDDKHFERYFRIRVALLCDDAILLIAHSTLR